MSRRSWRRCGSACTATISFSTSTRSRRSRRSGVSTRTGTSRRSRLRCTRSIPRRSRGDTYRKLVERDGKPLTAEELAKEDEKQEAKEAKKEARLYGEDASRRASAESERKLKETRTIDELFRIYEFQIVGREALDGRARDRRDLRAAARRRDGHAGRKDPEEVRGAGLDRRGRPPARPRGGRAHRRSLLRVRHPRETEEGGARPDPAAKDQRRDLAPRAGALRRKRPPLPRQGPPRRRPLRVLRLQEVHRRHRSRGRRPEQPK